MSRLLQFLAQAAATAYPEPRSDGHDSITQTMAAEVVKYLQPGACILDIGCGQGPALAWFREHGYCATGTTLCKEDLKHCEAVGFNVLMADMHSLPVRDGRFDCVWARHVLEHSVAPFFALHEMHRALKPGGIIYVEVPLPGTSCHHEANPNHYSVLTPDMWQSLIARTGFELLKTVTINLETAAGPDVYFCVIACKPMNL